MQIHSEYFTDQMLFDSISCYLHISDLLKLSQASRSVKQIIEHKCKRIIKNHNLLFIPSKTAIHQMRFYFDRCLTIYRKKDDIQQTKYEKPYKQKQKDKQQKQKGHTYQKDTIIDKKLGYALQLTIQNPFKYKTITYFQVGVQYTVCLTIDHIAYIFKTSTIVNLNINKKTQLNYQKRLNVVQIKCKGQNITYLKQGGDVYQVFGDKLAQKLVEKEEQLMWCQDIQVQQIQASFNYTIFRPKKSNICYEEFLKYIFGYEIDLEKVIKERMNKQEQHMPDNQANQDKEGVNKTTLVLLNNISFRYYLIEFWKEEKIIQMAVGNRQAYFLNEEYECFVCYFEQEEVGQNGQQNDPLLNNLNNNQYNKVLKAKLFTPFIDKPIIKIASGYNFFIALERKIHDVSKWTVDEVCKWVRQIGFGQFAKIFSVQKVNGAKLLTIDKNYMHSSLGITKPNMQQKFIMLLEQVIDNKNKEDTLYGWGKNQNGQLGSRNANFIKQPQRIKIPNCFKEGEYIDSIFCGWYQTFVRTQKGRVYRTVNFERKKKGKQNPKQQIGTSDLKINDKNSLNYKQAKKVLGQYQEVIDYQNENQPIRKNSTKSSKANRRNKNTLQMSKKIYQHHKKFQQQQKWTQCQLGKAFFVQGYKDILFYIQCPSQHNFQPAKQKKLRTAKMVLNKIIWSLDSQQQQLYKVGYMDKDMGMIQITIVQLKAFDYNENRIKYIKKQSHIVWDRQTKIDHFKG